MRKSDGSKHFSVVTRCEPSGSLLSNTCFATVGVAERYASREAVIRESQSPGQHVIYESDRVLYVGTQEDATRSIKVVVCYSEGCSLFRAMPKSHR